MNDTLHQRMRHRAEVAKAHTISTSGRAPAKVMVRESPTYDGRASEIFPIVFVNLVLTFLTFGLYRFWAKTRVRRYFLSRISFLDDRLEYNGTGKELFIGFLIVIAVLVPIGIGFEILSGAAATEDEGSFVFVQAGYLLLFYYLFHFAVFRATRYRLSRITWRGIRAGLTGSAFGYANRAVGWSLLTALTLGLVYPLMRVRCQAYKIAHACFGTERFRFEPRTIRLFAYWIAPWLLLAVSVTAIGYQISIAIEAYGEPASWLEEGKTRIIATALLNQLGPILGLGLGVFYISLFWYRAAELRLFAEWTQFDSLRFSSTLRGTQILVPYLLFGLLIAGILGTVGYVSVQALSGMAGSTIRTGAWALVGALLFFGYFLLAGLLRPMIIQNLLIRRFCNTLSVTGSFSPERLLQNQLALPRRGEGLADALDVDAF